MNAEKKFANRCERIRRIVYQRPGITKSELSLASASIDTIDRDSIIDHLIEVGKIRVEISAPAIGGVGGRPKATYWPAITAVSGGTQSEARGDADRLYDVRITRDEIRAVNELRRKQSGLPSPPMIALPI